MSGSIEKSVLGDTIYRCNVNNVGISDLGFGGKVRKGLVSLPARLRVVATSWPSIAMIETGLGVR